MSLLGERSPSTSSTTRISTDMEKLWRDEFFAGQGRTPVENFPALEPAKPQDELRNMTSVVRFAGGVYDRAIIEFYENIILGLQREIERYKQLWALERVNPESSGAYVARQPVGLSPRMAKKLKTPPPPSLRVPEE